MKKKLYLLLALLSLAPSMATQNVTKSLMIASTLVLSNKKYDRNLSLALHKAIENNNYTSAEKLITNPQVDINSKIDYGTNSWEKGWTPLIQCCIVGDQSLQIARLLLDRKDINVNLGDKDGYTPLIVCCNNKADQSLQIARLLLEHDNINVNLGNNNGFTPLMLCCLVGDKLLQIAGLLLNRKDINVNLPSNNGSTPLIMCSWKGDEALEIAKALLQHQEIKVNLTDKYGDTPLDTIIYYIKGSKKNYQYVNLWNALVAKGGILDNQKTVYENLNPSDFNKPQKGYVQSIIRSNPLIVPSFFHAIKKRDYTLAKRFINNPYVNVNLENSDGWTPLTACSWQGDRVLQIAKALLDRNDIKVNLQDRCGATPLIYCCDKGDQSLQIAELLLARNEIKVNLQDKKGRTALIMCCIVGDRSLKIAKALLEHENININLADKDGNMPLDRIIQRIQECIKNSWTYKYINLWNMLVAKGAILSKCITDYNNLNPSNFQEVKRIDVQSIKSNPPIDLKLSSFAQENELLRRQLEESKK